MKVALVSVVAIVAGLVLGTTMGGCEFGSNDQSYGDGARQAAVDSYDGALAQLESREYDFGKMPLHGKRSHEFVIRNVGSAPLKLSEETKSCNCTQIELPDPIPPGAEGIVRIAWEAKSPKAEFREHAELRTNDKFNLQIKLWITGQVVSPLRAIPRDLKITALAEGDETQASVQIFSYQASEINVHQITFGDPSTASLFEVSTEPMTAEQARIDRALCGIILNVKVKPGLPQGTICQTIVLATDLHQAPQIKIPVQIGVVAPIGIASPHWDSTAGVVKTGEIPAAGVSRRLVVNVRGKGHEAVKLEIASVSPKDVVAKLGEQRISADQRTSRYTLKLDVPAGTVVTESEFGEVRIKTTNPKQPELLLRLVAE